MKRTLLTFTAITSLLLPLAAPIVAVAQDGGRQRESAVQRRVEAAQRQLDRDTGTQRAPEARQERRQESRQQRSEPRREQRQEQRPQQRQEPRPDQRRNESAPQRRGDDAQRQYDRGSRDGQRRDYRQDRRNESPVQRRVEEAQRQLDRANGVTRDREDRYRDRRDDNRDNRRWDSRRDRPNAENRRDNYREFQRRWNAQQWRRDFNRDRRADWWRNDNRFRSWSGVRAGYYFAPGYGYYSVPRSYWNRQWQIGQYLPDVFWRYQVNDYRTYGLGYPPEGTRWVYVDNAIYLIDDYDGYIVEVIRDAWRW